MMETLPNVTLCETHSLVGSGEGRYNEDYALCRPEGCCAVLVDGATGLTKANVVAGESDAAWYARNLCLELAEQLGCQDTSMEDGFAQAGRRVAERFRQVPGAAALERIDEPNGSVVALRWHLTSGTLTVGLLGDCTAALVMRDGSVRVLHDDTLTQLDEENYARMLAYARERGTTMAQARKALNPRFIENRLKMNEPEGYWAADISCRGMSHVSLTVVGLAGVQGLFACSDGYAAAVDMGVVPDAAELARRVLAGEGHALGEALRSAEQADAGCWEHPRSKTSDDATYLALAFGDFDQ